MRAGATSRKIALAARRVLDKDGFEAITMRRVAKAVGITPMALYRHYPDHAGLLNALADEGFEELAGHFARTRFSGSIEEQLTKVLNTNIEFALQNPRLFELMFLRPREGARQFPSDFKAGKSPTANVMTQLIEKGMATGQFRQDDAWEITFETGALLQGLIMLFLGGRVSMSTKEFRTYCHRALGRYIHGIRK
jgi:AcrR family transcriptional regulator